MKESRVDKLARRRRIVHDAVLEVGELRRGECWRCPHPPHKADECKRFIPGQNMDCLCQEG